MKKYFYLFICLALAACGSQKSADISSGTSKTAVAAKVTAQAILSEIDKGKYVRNELLVKFKKGTAGSASAKVHKTVGASVIQNIKIAPNVERVRLQQGLSVKDAIQQYMSNPDVEYAEPNYIRKSASTEVVPNDLYFKDQWPLRNTGQYAYGTAGADIDATDAWRVSTGNYGIVIAVLDTGVDYSHNDLAPNMWRNEAECSKGINSVDDDGNGFVDDCAGWDFVTCEAFDSSFNCIAPIAGDSDPMDDDGHGTHVAGIIGAVGNNGVGISGVMWNALIMPVRVLGAEGGTDADIINGLEYAMDMGAKVVNASFGGYGESITLSDAFQEAATRGVLVVAAAGNESNNNDLNPAYPASYPFDNIISVAATDQDDLRVSFSNFGTRSVDVAAPGVYIISTVPTWWADFYGFGYLEEFDGTSMSAPHVSGLAGLLYSYYINFNSGQIRNMITTCVDVLPSLDGWVATRGRINAFSSMSALWEPYDLKLKQTGSQVALSWTDVATFEDHTIIERKTQGGTYAVLATLGQNVNSYTDTSGVSEGATYFYRVRLSNWIGESPGHPDNERSVSTALIAPSGLKATPISSSKVKLSWFDGSSTETGFRIFRHDGNGAYAQVKQVGSNVTTFTDTGLAKGTKYWYRVTSHNASGDSEPSNEAEVTTSNTSGSSGGGGGGGGCSIGARQNTPTALADMSVMLLPLLVVAVLRRRR